MFKAISYSKKNTFVPFVTSIVVGYGIFKKRRLREVMATEGTGDSHSGDPHVQDSVQESLKLKGLVVYFRHGARTPLRHLVGIEQVNYDRRFLDGIIPHMEVPVHVKGLDGGERPVCSIQEKYMGTKFQGGMVSGTLSKVGKDQVYLLGQRLRNRYIEKLALISSDFSQQDIFLRSSNIQRCVDSLQCVLAGMFGLKGFKGKEPAVISVANDSEERLYPNPRYCQSLRQMSRQVPSELEEFDDYAALVHKIQGITGDTSPVGRFDMMQHRDHIYARRAHGLPVPEWMTSMASDIDKAAVRAMLQYVNGPAGDEHLVLMLGCGPMLNLMKNNIEEMVQGKPDARKMYLYSCHDTSLVPIMISLGSYDNKWPDYAADITVELYEDKSKDHWVKVLYSGKEQILNGCKSALIPADKFQEMIQPYVLGEEDYTHKCKDMKAAKEHSAFWEAALTNQAEEAEAPPSI